MERTHLCTILMYGTVASSLVDIRPKKVVGKYLYQVLNSKIEYTQRIVNDEGAAQPNLQLRTYRCLISQCPTKLNKRKLQLILMISTTLSPFISVSNHVTPYL